MAKKHDDTRISDVEEVNLDDLELLDDPLDDPLDDTPAEIHFEEFIEKAVKKEKGELIEEETKPKK